MSRRKAIHKAGVEIEMIHGINISQYISGSPTERNPRHNGSALKNKTGVSEQVRRQLSIGALEIVSNPSNIPWLHPLSLVKKADGSDRLCIDLSRGTNSITKNIRFSYPKGPDTLRKLHAEGVRSTAVIDLKDGFFHVKIHPEDRKYLAFCWEGITYQYQRLPFGYVLSPYIFQKFIERLIAPYAALNYLDDILIWKKKSYFQIIDLFKRIGITINWKKSRPFSQQQTWVGYQYSLDHDGINWSIPSEKLKNLDKLARKGGSIAIASWLNFYDRMIPNLRRFKYWWYSAKNRRGTVKLPFEEFRTVHHKLLSKTKRACMNSYKDSKVEFKSILIADASDVGYATSSGTKTIVGDTPSHLKRKGIVYKEMFALYQGRKLVPKTDNLIILSDNQNVVSILNKRYSPKGLLREMTHRISSKRKALLALYVPTENNCAMDSLSRRNYARPEELTQVNHSPTSHQDEEFGMAVLEGHNPLRLLRSPLHQKLQSLLREVNKVGLYGNNFQEIPSHIRDYLKDNTF